MALIINAEKIADSVIQQEAERMRPRYEAVFSNMDGKEREAQLLDWSKENVIESVLLSQHAKKCGHQIPIAEVEANLARAKKQYRQQTEQREKLTADQEDKIKQAIELEMKVERLLRDVCKDIPAPSEQAISKFYEQNKEQFTAPERVRAAHILKRIDGQTNEAEALKAIRNVQDELKAGAIFETLVTKYSDCLDSDGDLGYFAKGEMVEEFEDVVFNLGVGQVSDIFRTRFGFHIAKVYDKKPAALSSLEEVRGGIVGELKEELQGEAINKFVDGLKKEAKIEEI